MGGSQRGATPINSAIARQREDDVVRLRTRERLLWREIAERMDCDEKTCREAWTRARTKSHKDAQDQLDAWRAEMLATCEAVIDGLMGAALKGDPRAAEAIVKTVERTAKLLGLDAPLKVNATVTDEITARIKKLAEELAEA
jgi:NAD(P)H-hydrate repair Nnr-like enzyme with NAD(P)H-hydrate epimerase domain